MDSHNIISCPNCGAAARNHQNCEYCGSRLNNTSLSNHSDCDYESKLNNTFIFPGLESELKKNLLLQKQGASSVCTEVTWQRDNSEAGLQFVASYMLNDMNKEGISLCVFMEKGSVLERHFQKMDIIKSFTFKECFNETHDTYAINYGEDCVNAALFFTVIAEELFGHTTDSTITFNTWHDNA